MARKASLAQIMAGDDALVSPGMNWNAPVVLPATPASVDKFAAPELHEGITALMIMNGCQAKWAVNFWRVSNRAGALTHVSGKNDFDEWNDAIKSLASRTVTR